jgi:serine/threonine protein kinase
MAPEQIEGRTEARSDLYGLGVVLYLFMTGRLPFTGSSSNAVMEAHLYRLPESPRRLNPEVTPALEMVIMQALAKRPEDRFATASEMGAALMAALVAGDSSPLPFANPISPLPYASLPPIVPSPSQAPMTPPRSGGSGYVVESQTSASGRRSSDVTAGPTPQLDPLLTSLSATLPAPYISVSESQGDSHHSGRQAFPSHISGSSRGASGPHPLSFPAAQEPGSPLTYRAGEVSNIRADQSMDPTLQLSTPQPAAFGISNPAIKQARRAGASPIAQELPRQSNSRVWIVAAIILTLLLGAAILLLRMAQSGTLFSM